MLMFVCRTAAVRLELLTFLVAFCLVDTCRRELAHSCLSAAASC